MMICPNCKHQEVDGSIFCTECGTQLIRYDESREHAETQQFSVNKNETTQQMAPDLEESVLTSPLKSDTTTGQPNAWISLHMLDSGQILPVAEKTEFTMGRTSDNQPIMPDIDFSAFKAYDNGVSRLHAVIRNNSGRIVIMDLGSSNGTYLNGTRLMPNVEQPLRHGDVVALGKLKMQIVLS